jgi:recombination protein RecT
MSIEQLKKHGTQYSQTFKKGFGLWKDNFDAMASKTVLKLLLSKYAPLSVDMQKAVVVDQAVINDYETIDVSHVDNDTPAIDKEAQRVTLMIEDATTIEDLMNVKEFVTDVNSEAYETKFSQLAEIE